MPIKYEPAFDIQTKADDISKSVFPHVKLDRVKCFRSYGSSSRGTIARCHAMGKIMQLTVGVKAHYALEFISERFDKMGEEEKMKVIIHELMHIPKSFGGGFKHHDWVCDKNINLFYRKYINMKQSDLVTEEIVDQNLSSENNGDERNKRLRDFLKW
ncbi:MAG: putative metallopeptidase [Nanoarchaeota archaeon]